MSATEREHWALGFPDGGEPAPRCCINHSTSPHATYYTNPTFFDQKFVGTFDRAHTVFFWLKCSTDIVQSNIGRLLLARSIVLVHYLRYVLALHFEEIWQLCILAVCIGWNSILAAYSADLRTIRTWYEHQLVLSELLIGNMACIHLLDRSIGVIYWRYP